MNEPITDYVLAFAATLLVVPVESAQVECITNCCQLVVSYSAQGYAYFVINMVFAFGDSNAKIIKLGSALVKL